MSKCKMHNNDFSMGVLASGLETKLCLHKCDIQEKIWYTDFATGLVKRCQIGPSAPAEIVCVNKANPYFERNTIQTDISVAYKGKGTFAHNEITGRPGSQKSLVQISTGAKPVFKKNNLHHNNEIGVIVMRGGFGTIKDNHIHNNGGAGIHIQDDNTDSKPKITNNNVHDNDLRQLDSALKDMVQRQECTLAFSGKECVFQDFYFCYTCDLTGNTGCCESCYFKCHKDKGHKVSTEPVRCTCFCDCTKGCCVKTQLLGFS